LTDTVIETSTAGIQQKPETIQKKTPPGSGRFFLYISGFLWGLFWFLQLTAESIYLQTAVTTAGLALGLLLDRTRFQFKSSAFIPAWWFTSTAILLTGAPGGIFLCALVMGLYLSQQGKISGRKMFFFGCGLCTAPLFTHLIPHGTTAAVFVGALLLINFFNDINFSRKSKIFAGLLYFSILFWQHPLLDMIVKKQPGRAEEIEITPITALSALALQPQSAPAVAVIASSESQIVDFFENLPFMVPFKAIAPGYVPKEKYDMIFVETMPAKPERYLPGLASRLNKDGVLAIPESFCNLLPEWKWKKLPGSPPYAAASPATELLVNVSRMENNLANIAENSGAADNFLRGAFSGVLQDFHSTALDIKANNSSKNMFQSLFIHFAALALLLELLALRNREVSKNLIVAKTSFCYTVLVTTVLSSASMVEAVRFPLLPTLPLLCCFIMLNRPVLAKVERISSLLTLFMLWLWFFLPGIISGILLLITAGLSYTGFRSRCPERDVPTDMLMQLPGITAGMCLIWLLDNNDMLFLPGVLTLISGYIIWITIKKSHHPA